VHYEPSYPSSDRLLEDGKLTNPDSLKISRTRSPMERIKRKKERTDEKDEMDD